MYKTVHTSYMHTKSFNVGNWSVGFFPSKYNNFTNIHPICTRGIFVWNVLLYYVARQLQLLFWGLGAVVAIATWPKARQPCTLSTFEFLKYKFKFKYEEDNLVLCQLLNFHNVNLNMRKNTAGSDFNVSSQWKAHCQGHHRYDLKKLEIKFALSQCPGYF